MSDHEQVAIRKLQRRKNALGDERRRKILLYIHEFKAVRDYSPNVREIAEAVGILSTSVINYHIERMKTDGILDYVPFQSRTVHLTHDGKKVVGELLQLRRKGDISTKKWLEEKVLAPS